MATKSQKTTSESSPAHLKVKTYTFQVSLPSFDCWRKIEMKSDQTLEMLHNEIQSAFDFDNDHLYSFYLSNKAWDKKTEYSLPEGVTPYGIAFDATGEAVDEGDWEDEEINVQQALNEEIKKIAGLRVQKRKLYQEAFEAFINTKTNKWQDFLEEWSVKLRVDSSTLFMQMHGLKMLKEMLEDAQHESVSDVRTVTIEDLKLRLKKKFMYLFDYGDEWRFQVQVVAINKAADDSPDFPRVIETFGEAPRQYPNGEDEWLVEYDVDELEDGDEFEDE